MAVYVIAWLIIDQLFNGLIIIIAHYPKSIELYPFCGIPQWFCIMIKVWFPAHPANYTASIFERFLALKTKHIGHDWFSIYVNIFAKSKRWLTYQSIIDFALTYVHIRQRVIYLYKNNLRSRLIVAEPGSIWLAPVPKIPTNWSKYRQSSLHSTIT